MSDELVVIATFPLPYQAELAKSLLEAENIECFIADEITFRTISAPLLADGIKLHVAEKDADKARKILEQELGA